MKTIFFFLVLLLSTYKNSNAQACFLPAKNFSGWGTHPEPYSITSADFNEDGKIDLAFTNEDSDDISVLIGNGDGTFRPATNFLTGKHPYTIIHGDYNNDDHIDLVVVNSVEANISLLLGKGDGTFANKINYQMGNSPISVITADFNSDSNLDLATISQNADTFSNLTVALGNGDGTFKQAVYYSSGNYPISITCGDYNGDLKIDIVTASSEDSNISMFFGDGKGNFKDRVNIALSNPPQFLASGDFNNDKTIDIAVATFGENPLTILLSNSDSTFFSTSNFPKGIHMYSVVCSDFNSDKNLDLAGINTGANQIKIMFGDGKGNFTESGNFLVGSLPNSLVVSDLDLNGHVDLATANYESGDVSVLLNYYPLNSIIDPTLYNDLILISSRNKIFEIVSSIKIKKGILEIYDLTGQKIFYKKFKQQIVVDLSSQTNTGNYLFNVKSNKKNISQKFITSEK